MNYKKFLKTKELNTNQKGFKIQNNELSNTLYNFQKFCVSWALLKGRAAIFSDCGTGKTLVQLEWGKWVLKETKKPILLLTPLAVAEQTLNEATKIKLNKKVQIVKDQKEIQYNKINITNYEKLHKFNPSSFSGIILDESGILKNHTGQFRTDIIDFSKNIPYRLACTATPAPNDYMELANHAEYLGLQSRTEVLSTYFIHDSGDTGKWRLKGHVQDNIFWKWLSNWAVMFSKPQDLGFHDDPDFDLPEIEYHQHFAKCESKPKKGLFHTAVLDLANRRKVRSESVQIRCEKAAELINSDSDKWLVWCGLNTESELMTKLVYDSLEVTGSQKNEIKKKRMLDFSKGKIQRLITKPKIAGYGMNWQVCSNVAFIGLNDSWEQLYQAIRRVWRFGQTKKVNVHFFLEEREGPVLQNVMRKEKQALEMQKSMIKIFNKIQIKNISYFTEYVPCNKMEVPDWIEKEKHPKL